MLQSAVAGYTIESGADAKVRKDGVTVARGRATGCTYTIGEADAGGAAFHAPTTPSVSAVGLPSWQRPA